VNDPRLLLLSPGDNVFVLREAVEAGGQLVIDDVSVILANRLDLGHKIARRSIAPGEKILKYGAPIGSATKAISVGDHVHIHNIKSDYTATHVIGRKIEEPAQ
jgi:hypothetical protein